MPTRKVSVGFLAGSIVAVLLLVLQILAPKYAAQVPLAAAGELSTIVGVILAYLIPEKDQAPVGGSNG